MKRKQLVSLLVAAVAAVSGERGLGGGIGHAER